MPPELPGFLVFFGVGFATMAALGGAGKLLQIWYFRWGPGARETARSAE